MLETAHSLPCRPAESFKSVSRKQASEQGAAFERFERAFRFQVHALRSNLAGYWQLRASARDNLVGATASNTRARTHKQGANSLQRNLSCSATSSELERPPNKLERELQKGEELLLLFERGLSRYRLQAICSTLCKLTGTSVAHYYNAAFRFQCPLLQLSAAAILNKSALLVNK